MTEPALPIAPRRYTSLDLLRVIAILMTVLAHTPNLRSSIPGLSLLNGGFWLGVDLFMLISGWLLGGQLLRDADRGSFDPLRFYVKRWMRTLPPYYAMLVLLQFICAPMTWLARAEHAVFIQQYVGNNQYMVSWSLCVEEHFYLLLPVLITLLVRRPRLSTMIGIVVSVEAVAIVCRVFAWTPTGGVPELTHMRWHGLFLGLAFAWIQLHRATLWAWLGKQTAWLTPVGIVGTMLVMHFAKPGLPSHWTFIVAPTVGTWTLALAFIAFVHDASPLSRIRFPGLEYLGGLTYAIYLTHNVWQRNLVDIGGGAGSLRGALWRFGIVIVAALTLHHVIERPALRFRDYVLSRWKAAPRRAVAAKSPSEAA
jgi:peptidoglycan/LPS O-acetylase OafA/YrhL